jgi:DNA-binding phage protein
MPQRVDAYAAADRYRRAVELRRESRAQMLEAIERERPDLNLAGIARRAGVQEKSLYRMLKRESEKRINGGS